MSEAASSASDRLAISRERLRLALRHSAGLDQPTTPAHTSTGWAGSMMSIARAVPGAEAVMDGLRDWWARHPMRAAATIAGDAVRGIAAPLARRQPLGMMVGALLVGALLARVRPWRWLPRTLMFAGLLPQVATRLVAAVPIESWLNALVAPPRKPPTPPPAVR